jgi:hypothetical protein
VLLTADPASSHKQCSAATATATVQPAAAAVLSTIAGRLAQVSKRKISKPSHLDGLLVWRVCLSLACGRQASFIFLLQASGLFTVRSCWFIHYSMLAVSQADCLASVLSPAALSGSLKALGYVLVGGLNPRADSCV